MDTKVPIEPLFAQSNSESLEFYYCMEWHSVTTIYNFTHMTQSPWGDLLLFYRNK